MLLKQLFESAELPTEFVSKAETLFEAAVKEKVDEKVSAELASLQEAFDSKLADSQTAFIVEATKTLDAVIEETIIEWAKENAVPLDNQVKSQLAEGFLTGLKGLFEKADIELSDSAAGKEIQGLTERVAELDKKVADAQAALTESTQKLADIKVKEIIAEATAGLADTVKHRVAKLCEAFAFVSEEDFKSKAALVVEAVGGIVKEAAVKGTTDQDGTVVAVPAGKAAVAQVADGSGAEPAPELVAAPATKPEIPKDKGAEGLRESYDAAKASSAPHHGEDLVALTLAMLK